MIRMAKRIQSLYSDLAGHSDDCEPTLYMRSRRSLVPSCEEQHFHRASHVPAANSTATISRVA